MKKGLCIGVGYTGHVDLDGESLQLDGSHGDAKSIAKLLTHGYGYDMEILLDDETHIWPTKDNIRAAIRRLVQDAQPDDCLFFHFSGHGDQIPNEDGSETDGWDEVILPLDWVMDYDHLDSNDRSRYVPTGIILDDELHDWLVKPLPAGCYLNALFDNCHSGTALDLQHCRRYDNKIDHRILENGTLCEEPDGFCSPTETTMDPKFPINRRKMSRGSKGTLELSYSTSTVLPSRGKLRSQSSKATRSGSLILRGESQDPAHLSLQGGHIYSWGACSDAQVCQESSRGGLMVEAFIACLEENRHPTYRQLLRSLNVRLRKKCLEINNLPKPRRSSEPVCQDPQFGSYLAPDMDATVVL